MKIRLHLLLTCLILVSAVLESPPTAHAQLATVYLPLLSTAVGPPTLAFVAGNKYGFPGTGIASIPVGGTEFTWIWLNGTFEVSSHPAYSADGQRLAFFFSPDYGFTTELSTLNADGTARMTVTVTSTSVVDMSGPTWSPDGSLLAFEASNEIYIINVDGTNQHVVTSGRYPAWSPDGTQLAFVGPGISTIAPDGSSLRHLTALSSDGKVAWSPDSQQIAFADSHYNIVIMTADGVIQREISHTGIAESLRDLSWSSDGLWLAFAGFDGTFFIARIKTDGTQLERIPLSVWIWPSEPVWRP